MSAGHAKAGRHSFIHDALVLLGNQFVVMSIGMISGVVMTRFLGASGRGMVAAVTVYPAILLSLAEMGVQKSSAYHLGKNIYSNAQVTSAVSAMVLLIGTMGVLLCTGLLVWMDNPSVTPLIIALAVAPIPFLIFTSYSSGIFLGNRLVGQFANIAWMVALLNLLAVLLFVWLLDWGAAGALLATLLSGMVATGYAVQKISKIASLRPQFEWPVVRALLLKGIVYAGALFVITMNYKVNIVVMERLSSMTEIGVFALGISIAQLTWALPQAIMTAIFSHGATAPDENRFSEKVQSLFRVTLVIALIIVAGLGITAPFLIPFIYGEEFRPSIRVLHLLLPGVFCLLGLKILYMDLAGRGRPNSSLWAMVPALAINAVLSSIWVPLYGAQGAAVAASIGYAIGGIGMTIVYCRYVGIGMLTLWQYKRSDFYFIDQLLPPGLRSKNRAS